MKPSPLRLEWVVYPSLRYEARPSEASAKPIPTSITAKVIYFADGRHGAELHLESAGSDLDLYTFAVDVVATFSIDVGVALEAYRCKPAGLPRIVAANIARVLYSGARELLATATGRSPHGPALIESVLIEPSDVTISSNEPIETILRDLFRVDEESLAQLRGAGPQKEQLATSAVGDDKKKRAAKKRRVPTAP